MNKDNDLNPSFLILINEINRLTKEIKKIDKEFKLILINKHFRVFHGLNLLFDTSTFYFNKLDQLRIFLSAYKFGLELSNSLKKTKNNKKLNFKN